MLVKRIQGLFSHDLLVELRESLLTVKSFSDNRKFEVVPIVAIETRDGKSVVREIGAKAEETAGLNVEICKPFTHSRSLISSFTHAEFIIQYAIKSIHSTYITPAPRIVMHQLEKNEGGLTEIEARVLRELALGAGAREVLVYTGLPVNPAIETYDSIKSRSDT